MEKDLKELEAEFQEFYNTKARPILPEYEQQRKKDAPILAAAIVMIASIFGGIITPAFFIVTLICFFILVSIVPKGGAVINMDYEIDLKSKLMPEFLNIFGTFRWSKYVVASYKEFQKKLKEEKIFPFNLFLQLDDIIEGVYKNTPIRIIEAKTGLGAAMIIPLLFCLPVAFIGLFAAVFISTFLIILFGKIGVTIVLCLFVILVIAVIGGLITLKCKSGEYQGAIIEINMNKRFKGHTFLYENKSTNSKITHFERKPKNSTLAYKEVKLEDVDFSKLYKIYSTDQIEARYLLTTSFMERFKNIKLAFNAQYIRASFKDKKLTIFVNTNKDLFAMGSITKSTTTGTFQELFKEIYSVLELVEDLKLNQNIGL